MACTSLLSFSLCTQRISFEGYSCIYSRSYYPCVNPGICLFAILLCLHFKSCLLSFCSPEPTLVCLLFPLYRVFQNLKKILVWIKYDTTLWNKGLIYLLLFFGFIFWEFCFVWVRWSMMYAWTMGSSCYHRASSTECRQSRCTRPCTTPGTSLWSS